MIDIKLSQINQTYVHVDTNLGIARELYDYFSFYVPNYKFMPTYRNKIWDGKIRLYDGRKNTIYSGLEKKIREFCEKNNYTFQGLIDNKNSISMKDIVGEVFRINGTKTAFEHQLRSLAYTLRLKKSVLLSPTASGKSFFIYLLIRIIKEYFMGKKGLIIVPSLGLITQLKNDFIDYSGNNNWDVENNIHLIYQGQDKQSDKPIYISTWQSIDTLPKKYFEQFDYVIVDECHHAKAKSIKYILENCINAEWRIGTTGTLDGVDVNALVLEGLFGPIKQIITTNDLQRENKLSDLEIQTIILEYDDHIRKELSKKTYQEQYEYLIGNQNRKNFIVGLTKTLQGNKLLLYQMVDKYGKVLYDTLRNEIKDGPVYFISGKTPALEREEIRKKLEVETNATLVASYGTCSTGINIPSLKHVISTTPGKSRIRILQSIGRSLRLSPGKTKAYFFDIADDFSWKSKTCFGITHLEERMKMYILENFEIKTRKVKL